MLINGQYGSGKSTLLAFIEEENNKKNKFNIIKYDAWENNFFENPIIPILYTISQLENLTEKLKNEISNMIKNVPKAIFNTLANASNIDIKTFTANENIFKEYDLYKASIIRFKKRLTKLCAERKIIFLVDELDRCLPEYQIKVLESLYHLLDIPNLIVVIAMDKKQLEYSIKCKFGDAINVYEYLSKFINYEINLPNNDVYQYIKALMKFDSQYIEEVKNLLSNIFKVINMSIRDCQIIISELNLICNEKNEKGATLKYYYWYPILACILLIIKKTNNDIYLKYFFDQKYSINYENKIKLKDTVYYKFLNDIKSTELNNIFS